ncbi:anthranilate synthase component II [Spirosoma utsteinense]|uniref:Anthranilate synthase component 2 n=1 Tax=Spirosoma utsteinense TaxID=2585773 RepID=A0ABR6W9N0_9BACT|nr:aminodeoxychorismate/anthranilate synthase component II [Spirosoma utsteinense]MBC3786776.1 anthranilate synthase component 2 [Spirosoma utsteinense]MBC3793281.1 anthranilate synthase component 2 [Spirosoma utsteinense]
MKLLIVDNFDSFTYMLVDYLRQAGAECRIVRNNEPMEQFTSEWVDGVVLSPGPGVPRQAGQLMDIIAHFYQRVPILGVCLGHQALGEFFGARLVTAHRPMHGKVSDVRVLAADELLRNLPSTFAVTRYHSLLLTSLPADLIATAATDSGEVMALRHRTLPLWGVQFHPEAVLTQNGLQLLINWVDSIKRYKVKQLATAPLTVRVA